jgi:small subunit ribosomal protein S6
LRTPSPGAIIAHVRYKPKSAKFTSQRTFSLCASHKYAGAFLCHAQCAALQREQSQGKEPLLSNYELTFILRPTEEANLTAMQERIAAQIQNAGGEIVARHDWGRRRLAYPIRKNTDGYYTTLYLTLPGAAVRTIERSLKLSDDVLRFLFVRVEKHTLPQAPAPAAETAPAAEPAPEAPAPTATTETAATPAAEPSTEETTATTAEG